MKVYSKVFLLLATIGLVACDSDNDSTVTPTPDPVFFADVQVLHGSADAPAVDVLVDGSVFVGGLDYKDSSVGPNFQKVPTASRCREFFRMVMRLSSGPSTCSLTA